MAMVQFRDKSASSMELYEQTIRIKKITVRYGIPLLVNDCIDIASANGADGVHIGRSDISATIARKIIERDILLSVFASYVNEALQVAPSKYIVYEDVLQAVKSAK